MNEDDEVYLYMDSVCQTYEASGALNQSRPSLARRKKV